MRGTVRDRPVVEELRFFFTLSFRPQGEISVKIFRFLIPSVLRTAPLDYKQVGQFMFIFW